MKLKTLNNKNLNNLNKNKISRVSCDSFSPRAQYFT